MKILLIYELIPEDTHFYLFENVNPASELYQHLVGANGHYINYDGDHGDNESTEFLNTYLSNRPKLPVEKLPEIGAVDMVVHSGFGL